MNIIKLNKLAVYIAKCYPKGLKSIVVQDDILYININKEILVNFVIFLKNHSSLKFVTLLDIWGVDYPSRIKRFEVNYLLLSIKYNLRIILKVTVAEDESIESLVNIFNSANWLERETWDMFGIYFANNLDLRRILTDYGFNGYPLRKDFPLSGYVEVRYDDGEKRVVQEPLEMTQEFRYFNFSSPWEMKKVV